MLKPIQMLLDPSKYNLKCPNEYDESKIDHIAIHNTANDAPARNEISYMIRNNHATSYHLAVDDSEIVQGVPFSKGSFACGNREADVTGINLEICYSLSGGARFDKAEELASKYIAQFLVERNWTIANVTKHQDYSGKYCPHRTLDKGWQRFLNMIQFEIDNLKGEPEQPSEPESTLLYKVQTGAFANKSYAMNLLADVKSKGYDTYLVEDDGLFKVQVGAYSVKENAENMASKLKKDGYDTYIVNSDDKVPSVPALKSNYEVAKEVIEGLWGNGETRRVKLEAAGYNYSSIQHEVNKILS